MPFRGALRGARCTLSNVGVGVGRHHQLRIMGTLGMRSAGGLLLAAQMGPGHKGATPRRRQQQGRPRDWQSKLLSRLPAPVRDFLGSPAVLTNCLVALNVAAFAAQVLTEGRLTAWGAKFGLHLPHILPRALASPWQVSSGSLVYGILPCWASAAAHMKNSMLAHAPRQWHRLLTCTFLHANIGHLAMNMYSLTSIGRSMERVIEGPGRYALIYCLGGLGGSVCSWLRSPYDSVGASGAIFALLGAQTIFFLRNQEALGDWGVRCRQALQQGVLLNLMIGLTPGSRLDQWGHIGGLVSGIVLEFLLGRRLQRNGLMGITEAPPLIPIFGKQRKKALT